MIIIISIILIINYHCIYHYNHYYHNNHNITIIGIIIITIITTMIIKSNKKKITKAKIKTPAIIITSTSRYINTGSPILLDDKSQLAISELSPTSLPLFFANIKYIIYFFLFFLNNTQTRFIDNETTVSEFRGLIFNKSSLCIFLPQHQHGHALSFVI